MTTDKFKIEIDVLKKFYELYCKDKHENQKSKVVSFKYKQELFHLELYLCNGCFEAIEYSFDRLQGCPHDIKPRCRSCPTPCYEKNRWKSIAKVMKYSAIKLSVDKVKSRIINIFS